MHTQKELTDHLINNGTLKTQSIVDAFLKIDRNDFVLDQHKEIAYIDRPLSIGHGQTISQPSVVSFMLELLKPNKEDYILDIGSGSGWTTALLAQCVQPTGHIYGVERISELVKFGQQNLEKYHFKNAKIVQAVPNILGLPSHAPFDKILVSAATPMLPEALVSQVKQRIIIPLQNSICKIEKKSNNDLVQKNYYGFSFVPLIHHNE